MKLRPYQESIIDAGCEILLKNKFVYLAMEVRTGKTLTSLGIADKVKAKCFVCYKEKSNLKY